MSGTKQRRAWVLIPIGLNRIKSSLLVYKPIIDCVLKCRIDICPEMGVKKLF